MGYVKSFAIVIIIWLLLFFLTRLIIEVNRKRKNKEINKYGLD